MQGLERETGIGRTGLFNTLGSKHGLFRETLTPYINLAIKLIPKPLRTENTGWAKIAPFFHILTLEEGLVKGNPGCLVYLTMESEVGRKEP